MKKAIDIFKAEFKHSLEFGSLENDLYNITEDIDEATNEMLESIKTVEVGVRTYSKLLSNSELDSDDLEEYEDYLSDIDKAMKVAYKAIKKLQSTIDA